MRLSIGFLTELLCEGIGLDLDVVGYKRHGLDIYIYVCVGWVVGKEALKMYILFFSFLLGWNFDGKKMVAWMDGFICN